MPFLTLLSWDPHVPQVPGTFGGSVYAIIAYDYNIGLRVRRPLWSSHQHTLAIHHGVSSSASQSSLTSPLPSSCPKERNPSFLPRVISATGKLAGFFFFFMFVQYLTQRWLLVLDPFRFYLPWRCLLLCSFFLKFTQRLTSVKMVGMRTTKFRPSVTAAKTEKNCQNPLFQGPGKSQKVCSSLGSV